MSTQTNTAPAAQPATEKSSVAQTTPVQEPVAFKQFLSDVHTAAGLVTHGKQCKSLGQRLSEGVMRYMGTMPAAPVQEPVEYWNAVEGWVKIDEVREHFDSVGCGTIYKTAGDGRVPLTAAQRQWVGLTDDERMECIFSTRWSTTQLMDTSKAIEAKLKEKNNGFA
jgi:hypothetical protein